MSKSRISGENPYPSVAHLAAWLAWRIITNHVFIDGNKRTGMAAAMDLMWANGVDFETTADEVIEVALAIATQQDSGLTYDGLVEWFEARIRPLPR